MSKILDIIKNNILPLIFVIMLVCVYFLGRCSATNNTEIEEKIEFTDNVGIYHQIYQEEDFKSLKNENKSLYDSLKKYKDEISYLIQFKARNEYSTGKVVVNEDTTENVESYTYEYTNEPNDTMTYSLKINAEKEPNWYSIDITTNNQYTIINKSYGDGNNHVTIEGDSEISDVIVYKKKEKRGFWNRFSFGPGVTAGYDPVNNRFGVVAGVTVSFDLK